MSGPWCFLDTETDSLRPDRKAWDVAMVRREPDGRERTEHFFVALDLTTADPAALAIGRFYERHPLGRRLSKGPGAHGQQKTVKAAAYLVAEYTHGAQIVGATPNFDTEVLAGLLREVGFTPAWHHRLRCVTTLAAGHLRRDTGGLTDTARALGIEPETAHTALGDARTAMAIWDHIMNPEATP